MATEFGTGKTIFILAIVVGCFAILWPKIFYPMLQSSVSVKPNIIPTTDCCDVIFEKDLNAIKIMTQLCEKILSTQSDFDKRLLLSFQQGKLTKEIVKRCNDEVHDKCNVDIKEFLMEKVRLGKSYHQMLSELRTLNSSFCLKINFGVSPGLIGAPRRMRVWEAKQLRQERPPHLRPHMDMMHPALREKGRAIPHSHVVPRVMDKDPAATPLPMPGMRPPMGGAGHVVPPPKGTSTMGIIMPLYTIGIVIFFMYTMMKLIFKKSDESSAYKEFQPDPEFRKAVFSDIEYPRSKIQKEIYQEEKNTKLVVSAISGLVAEVNRDILSKQGSIARPEDKHGDPEREILEKEEETVKQVEKKGAEVHVVGMEMTESIEGGQKWSRPPTPLTAPTPPPAPEPQNIYLEGSLPSQTQLLVSQSEIEKLTPESDESPVILSGKVTLSLIGIDDAIASGNGPVITAVSDEEEEASEEELEEECNIEEVSEEEADLVEDVGVNDEEPTTNYTTASAVAGGLGDETVADFSIMEPNHKEAGQEFGEEKEEEEEEEEDELEEDAIKPQMDQVLDQTATTNKNEKQSLNNFPKSEDIQNESYKTIVQAIIPKNEERGEQIEDEDEEEEEEEELEEDDEEIPKPASTDDSLNVKKSLTELEKTQSLSSKEVQDNEDEEEQEDDASEQHELTSKTKASINAGEHEDEEVEEEEEEEEEDEEEEDDEEEDEEIERPQSLQRQPQR